MAKKDEIKMTCGQAAQFLNHKGTEALLKKDADSQVPGKIRYWIARVYNKLMSEMKAYDSEVLKIRISAAVKKDGKPQRDARGQIVIDPLKQDWAREEIEKLNDQEIILSGINWLVLTDKNVEVWGLSGLEVSSYLMITKDG